MRASFVLVPLLALSGVGCAAATRDASHATHGAGPRVDEATCANVDALLDLATALELPAAGAEGDTARLVDVDEELGTIRFAREPLAAQRSSEARALAQELATLAAALEERRASMQSALMALAKSQDEVERALDEAAHCGDVDLRRPSSATRDDARATKARRSALSSKACEPAVRLWSAVADIDPTSAVSASSVGAHVKELSLGDERGRVRDRLARALVGHAKALERLHDRGSDDALATLRARVVERTIAAGAACIEAMPESERVVGGGSEPRQVTVTVRPRWSGSLASLPHPVEFGSGFVVRWRDAAGHVETRIVTNAHVMDGADEADIVVGERAEGDDAAPIVAQLLSADAHEDVAVLRVARAPRGVLTQGIALRLTPAREDEPVVAAGFPGVGARPSFQISRGIVSNARFGADGAPAHGLRGLVQHTAAIDPGNSGGPLLDGSGRLLGMNTLKIAGRENVGLAIPAARIQLALLRADRPRAMALEHARAACNVVVSTLATAHPSGGAIDRFGVALYEQMESRPPVVNASRWEEAIAGEPSNPVELARLHAYGAVRASVEQERGVRPFETCTKLEPRRDGSFSATFRTRTRSHTLTLAAEHGAMRATGFD